jgi:hypothetical protein
MHIEYRQQKTRPVIVPGRVSFNVCAAGYLRAECLNGHFYSSSHQMHAWTDHEDAV